MKVSIIISLSLSLLFITKYYAFFRELILEALVDVSIQQPLPLLDIIIPAGISFFTFQAITYLVWQKNTEESGDLKQKITFVDLLLYLAFWPTLFAGPIFRARDFFTQLYADNVGKPLNTEKAIFFILLGLFQKVVLSHWLAITFVEDVFTDPEKQNILTVSSGAWAYALQIFFDFSGYSLLVTGLGLLMGFQIPINFKQPYLAKNLQDFY
jgi:D-alanyl-lipoteichoic acid acyltransferase DltB (MBOAT superfamily)